MLGSGSRRFAEIVGAVSGGSIAITILEPGQGPAASSEAVREGRVEAAWGLAAYWSDLGPAGALFSGAPFGPDPAGTLAWLRAGGGQELHDSLYAGRGLKGLPCAIAAAEGGGWFKKEIRSTRDLDGVRMRVFGLGAKVLAKLGVRPVLPEGDVFQALSTNVIDAAEYASPSVDAAAAFDRVARYYYFPGWHQPATVVELLIALPRWQALTPRQQADIEAACGDNLRHTLAESEAAQAAAIADLGQRGVQLRRWPDRVLADLRQRWTEVAAEEGRADPAFARTYESLRAFSARYATWRELSDL